MADSDSAVFTMPKIDATSLRDWADSASQLSSDLERSARTNGHHEHEDIFGVGRPEHADIFGGRSGSLHGARIVSHDPPPDPTRLEGFQGRRARVGPGPTALREGGVASALNPAGSPPMSGDLFGRAHERGKKLTDFSDAARRHGVSGERELFTHHVGGMDLGQRARAHGVSEEYDIFGSKARNGSPAAQHHHARVTSLSSGQTEDALLQVRTASGKVQYMR
jgi:hypothetical protein